MLFICDACGEMQTITKKIVVYCDNVQILDPFLGTEINACSEECEKSIIKIYKTTKAN